MSARKICLNCPTSYYTGKEQSPLHFGLSAEGYEINSIMEGFDKDLWIVEVRNNKKVWTKKEHINKMTYEIPLINETTHEVMRATQVTQGTQVTQVTQVTQGTQGTTEEPEVTSQPEPIVESQVATVVHTPANDIDTETVVTTKEKISKTIKPTDYTLFITYRINQLKEVSGDNKKNYDCARYEWKEYKNKPDELRKIMAEAIEYHKK
jgi:hypothetical protein